MAGGLNGATKWIGLVLVLLTMLTGGVLAWSKTDSTAKNNKQYLERVEAQQRYYERYLDARIRATEDKLTELSTDLKWVRTYLENNEG